MLAGIQSNNEWSYNWMPYDNKAVLSHPQSLTNKTHTSKWLKHCTKQEDKHLLYPNLRSNKANATFPAGIS